MMRRFVGRRQVGSALLAVLVALAGSPSGALAADFPSYDSRYHNYAEMSADVAAVAAARPSIVRRFSIARSYQGRELWAAKVSDNVGVDESEPEVLFNALHHAREHLTAEMTLYILHLLADNYGRDSRITNLVNTREI